MCLVARLKNIHMKRMVWALTLAVTIIACGQSSGSAEGQGGTSSDTTGRHPNEVGDSSGSTINSTDGSQRNSATPGNSTNPSSGNEQDSIRNGGNVNDPKTHNPGTDPK